MPSAADDRHVFSASAYLTAEEGVSSTSPLSILLIREALGYPPISLESAACERFMASRRCWINWPTCFIDRPPCGCVAPLCWLLCTTYTACQPVLIRSAPQLTGVPCSPTMQTMHGDNAAFWASFKRYQQLRAAKAGNRAPALAASSSAQEGTKVSTVKRGAAA